ncbi:hypothetical protein GCM10023322_19770 [Rugosimonospora acidiphila]|uniref:Uncharacterized protein n=1 Tax=Rugosimonospora acidiphila TaxID=556531 RepID=A0ABP9RPC6_9ACTN
MGSTRTTVSVRSLALIRTRAPATDTVARMGSGVANVGMMVPLQVLDGEADSAGEVFVSAPAPLSAGGSRTSGLAPEVRLAS